jgi:lysophospholipase L1-like esterase
VNQDTLPATTLYLAGDSTVMDYGKSSAQEGWGQELGQYFIGKVTIDNRAIGGASIQSFQSRWTGIVGALKSGDYVMADFGINDSGSVAGRSVTPANFKRLMSAMNSQVKAKKATFIIVTPSALQYWEGNRETNARLAPYVAVEVDLGIAEGIPVDDLNARSLEFLNMIGKTAAQQIYLNGDKAHFTKLGATQMASFVALELKRISNPLAAYLK